MRKISVLLYLSFTVLGGYAQAVQGDVLDDQTDEPIPYVHIWFQGTTIGTYSSSIGRFQLKHTSESGDSLIFSCVGYETRIVPTSFFLDSLTVRLKPKPVLLNDVVISAGREKKKFQDLGFKSSKIGFPLVSVIWENWQQQLKVVIEEQPNQASWLHSLNIKIRELETSTKAPLLVEIMLMAGETDERFLLEKPLYVSIDKSDLPEISINLEDYDIAYPNESLNVYITLLGFESADKSLLLPASASISYSSKKSSQQATFLRRGEEESWDDSRPFFGQGKKFSNLNIWVTIAN